MTVNGSGFVPGSTVEWNYTPRLTTFVSSTQITATIYASDIAVAGVAQVMVVNPGQGYATSGAPALYYRRDDFHQHPRASLSPATLAFGSQTVGSPSTAQTATLTNSSSVDLTDVATLRLTGANAESFAQSNNCGTTVSAGTSCTVSVVFTPAGEGAQAAALTVSDSAAISPQEVTLTGTGAESAVNNGLRFVPVTPCRIADTRNPTGPFGGPELTADSSREFAVPQSACNIPPTAVAYSVNVTVVPDAALNYLTLWPSGQVQPYVSTLQLRRPGQGQCGNRSSGQQWRRQRLSSSPTRRR